VRRRRPGHGADPGAAQLSLLERLRARADLVPADLRASLEAEGIVVSHPSVSTTLRFENYRAPGKYSALRKTRVRSALVVTKVRLAVYVRGPFVNVPYADERFDRLDLRTTDDALMIGFDPALFNPESSGRIDVTCRVPEPERVLEWIRAERRAAP
jgi:hypothetical protein